MTAKTMPTITPQWGPRTGGVGVAVGVAVGVGVSVGVGASVTFGFTLTKTAKIVKWEVEQVTSPVMALTLVTSTSTQVAVSTS